MINSIINFLKGLFKQKESKTKYGNAKHFGFWDESYMKDQSFEKSIAPRDQVWTENKIDEDVQYQMGDVEESPSMEALHNVSIPDRGIYVGLRRTEGQEKEKEEMSKFDEIIEVVLEHEGGYVNDPKDPGGETNFGIAKRSNPDVDIKNLTKAEASLIYKTKYWDKNKVESLPEELWHIYFDCCVNMGKSRAVKILQQAANGKGANIDVDGGLGPNTLKAISNVELERVRAYRVKYYADLVTRKPDLEKFYFGWYKRALEV